MGKRMGKHNAVLARAVGLGDAHLMNALLPFW